MAPKRPKSLHWRPEGQGEILSGTMPQPNVEIVRAIIDSLNRRNLDQAVEAAHEDFEADWSNSIAPHRGVYRGRERARELFEAFLEAWEEFQWDPQELVEVDDSRVLVVSRVRGRGRGSGVEVDASGAQLWTISGGQVRGVKLYQSKAEALEAVGVADS
jgi:ketosteroid isomerase-like protein